MFLHFPLQSFSFADLCQDNKVTDVYLQDILNFCKDWLQGRNEFIIHTSGSTGQPKPILLQRNQMESSAQATADYLDLREETKALLCLHAGFIAGKMMIVRALVNKWELTVVPPSSLPFTNFSHPFDFVAVVPSQLQQTLEHDKSSINVLNQYKSIIIGGAAISGHLELLIRQNLTVPTYHTYGMTETVSHIALKRINGQKLKSYFNFLPNVEIDLDNRNCLKIKAPMTANEWITTNDRVDLITDEAQQIKSFDWVGRVDNIINSGGIKIQIEKVEVAVDSVFVVLGLSNRFCIVALEDKLWGETVNLVIEMTRPQDNLIEEKLKKYLKETLTNYEVPKNIFFIPQFPETNTAKIDRKKLQTLLVF